MQFPSRLIEEAVNEISRLPGIGKKTALRLVLFLLKQDEHISNKLAESILNVRFNTHYCEECNNISDEKVCSICQSFKRDKSILCIVEDTRDVLALENTSHYNGIYFVLGGVISPMDGIGPSELKMDMLFQKFPSTHIKEVILALSPTIDGDTTSFYISKKLKPYNLKITTIARGIPVGSELEYMDEITLGRSIQRRINYEMD
ncbi:MAG: recombination mediator RecR [Bacteroidota bacterium]|nr:recombination mediator RecR [Bacteroidota bacterium]